jgi:PPOX class probable F420-dependent enzyme
MTDTASGSYFASLAKARYLRLTTFKRQGTPVSAPVPGIVDGDRAYFGAWSRSGTVRRLQHTDGVQVAPCSALGLVSYGPPLDAAARRLTGQEASHIAGQLARTYPVRRRSLARLLQRARGRLVYYELLGGPSPEAASAMAKLRWCRSFAGVTWWPGLSSGRGRVPCCPRGRTGLTGHRALSRATTTK